MPVTDGDKPDYNFMEEYGKTLMTKKYRQYLDYLDYKQ